MPVKLCNHCGAEVAARPRQPLPGVRQEPVGVGRRHRAGGQRGAHRRGCPDQPAEAGGSGRDGGCSQPMLGARRAAVLPARRARLAQAGARAGVPALAARLRRGGLPSSTSARGRSTARRSGCVAKAPPVGPSRRLGQGVARSPSSRWPRPSRRRRGRRCPSRSTRAGSSRRSRRRSASSSTAARSCRCSRTATWSWSACRARRWRRSASAAARRPTRRSDRDLELERIKFTPRLEAAQQSTGKGRDDRIARLRGGLPGQAGRDRRAVPPPRRGGGRVADQAAQGRHPRHALRAGVGTVLAPGGMRVNGVRWVDWHAESGADEAPSRLARHLPPAYLSYNLLQPPPGPAGATGVRYSEILRDSRSATDRSRERSRGRGRGQQGVCE